MDIKDSYLHGTVGVVKSISVTADKLSYKLADVAGTTKTVTLPLATQSANGLLSKEDKTKLDNMVATKVANDLILKINSGATEGTSLYTYNGSSAKTLDIKSGTGIGFTNNAGSLQIYNTGVRSIATGTTNGTISVNTNGTSSDVAVKGLGSAAYKETVNFLLIVHRPSLTNGSNTYDLNNSYNSDCIIHDYQWTNSPNNKINSVINLVYLTDWKNQLMFTPLLTTISYRSYSGDTKSWSNWKTVAFTDSNITGNAATATKLQTARTLTIGNSAKTFDGSANVSWPLHDILFNNTSIGVNTSWDIYTPGVYFVSSSSAFTGTNNPEAANGGSVPYRYGLLIVSRANTGGVALFYVSHNDSSDSSAYSHTGIKFRTGWNNTYINTWRTLLDTHNYIYHLDSRYYTETEADNRFVNVSGDTMTGALYFSDNVGVYNSLAGMLAYVTSGNEWTGATNLANTVVVGTTSANTVIRSSGDTLYHYNTSAGSRYKIWDAGNSNLYTVPWSVSLLHIGASNKFLGTNSGVNDIWVKCGDIYMLNCNEAESCVRRGTNAAHITLGSSTYPWKGLYSGTGHFTGNVTLYSASGDSPMLYFLRGDINYTDTFDWRMFVSGGHFYLQHDSGAWTNGLQINYTGEAYVHGALILTTSNITSRNLTINGTGRMFYSSYTTDCGNIYAPTTAGTANLYLISNGSGAPIWKTIDPYDYNISRTANTVLAAPNGSAGKATFRKLVVADLPISARSLTVNGTAYTFYSSTTTAAASFYAPTGAGTSGYILQSNGSGAPSWTSRLSYSYPGVIWVGYIYRTARSYTTWYASSQGGSASVSMYISSPTSSNNYQVALQSSTHTILGGMCSIQAQFNAGKDGGQTTEGPLYAYSTVDVSKIEEAGPDVLVSSVYGGRFYIKAMRASDANNTSYYFDGLAFTGAGKDTNSLPLARINIILFGY